MLRPIVLAALAVLFGAASAPAQIGFDRDSLLTRTALGRLGLEKNWSTVVPLGSSDDRVLNLSRSHGMLFAQTSGGMIHAYDAETGRYLWGTALSRGMVQAFPAAVSGDVVITTAGQTIFGLDRRTGRIAWKGLLDGLPATGVVADDEYAVLGQQNGKLTAYNLLDRSKKDPPGHSPGTFAWAVQTEGTLHARPMVTPRVVVFGSQDKRVYASVIPELGAARVEPLYRFLTDGPIRAPLAGYGTRLLIVPSEDEKLYGIDLFRGQAKWSVSTGDPINHEPLVVDNEVFAVNSRGRVIAINGDTGQVLWDRATEGLDILAVSPARVYLMTPNHDLVILDRSTGQILASARDVVERAGLNTRQFTVEFTNEEDDRIYLATPSGMLYSLREMGRLKPVPLRDPNLPEFGYIPPEGLREEKPAPIGQAPPGLVPAEPAPAANPADAGADDENDR
jgi:outer membrane protein assembly factor BamB